MFKQAPAETSRKRPDSHKRGILTSPAMSQFLGGLCGIHQIWECITSREDHVGPAGKSGFEGPDKSLLQMWELMLHVRVPSGPFGKTQVLHFVDPNEFSHIHVYIVHSMRNAGVAPVPDNLPDCGAFIQGSLFQNCQSQ